MSSPCRRGESDATLECELGELLLEEIPGLSLALNDLGSCSGDSGDARSVFERLLIGGLAIPEANLTWRAASSTRIVSGSREGERGNREPGIVNEGLRRSAEGREVVGGDGEGVRSETVCESEEAKS